MLWVDIHNDFVCTFVKLFSFAFLKYEILYLDGTLTKLFFLLLVIIFSNSWIFSASSSFSTIFTFSSMCFVIRYFIWFNSSFSSMYFTISFICKLSKLKCEAKIFHEKVTCRFASSLAVFQKRVSSNWPVSAKKGSSRPSAKR